MERRLSADDISRFLEDRSDFAFEMQVLAALNSMGLTTQHGGTYRDPITDKIRQFDIRAVLPAAVLNVHLAVECKNLRPDRPLIVHSVARTKQEAYHELIVRPEVPMAMTRVARISGQEAAYPAGQPVGKQTDQVARKASGAFVSGDAEAFDKVSQAVNSAYGVIANAGQALKPYQVVAVLPVLVVPSHTLWQVQYEDGGEILSGPELCDSVTLFLGHSWPTRELHGQSFTLSHLEICTLEGMPQRITNLSTQLLFRGANRLLVP